MSKPSEHKTVQARILEYAAAIGWTFVSQKEAETRRGIGNSKLEIGKGSLFFEDLLDAKVREFNPRYAEAEGALPGKFRHLHTNIYGNRELPGGRCLNRRERRERIEDLDSGSLRSLCSLRFAYAEAIGWTLVSQTAGFVLRLRRAKGSCWRVLNHRERREHKEDLDSGSLSSLRSLRFPISEFRGFDRRDRRERKGDSNSESLSSLRSLRLSIHRALNRSTPVPEMSFRTCGGRASFQP